MPSFTITKDTSVKCTSVERTTRRIDMQVTKSEIASMKRMLKNKEKKLATQQKEYWQRTTHNHKYDVESESESSPKRGKCNLCDTEAIWWV